MRRSNLTVLAIGLLIAACQPAVDRFAVSGQIAGADGSMLYLDHMGLDRVQAVDSARLDAAGSFTFRQPAPEGCFDIYRLRLDGKTINFSVDSTEAITITANAQDMQTAYTVSGSPESEQIKQVVLMQMQLLRDLKKVQDSYAQYEIGTRQQRVNELVDVFKSDLRNKFIFVDPSSPAAYYSLFLSINSQMLFNPSSDRQDAKTYAAVATSMDINYPEAQRTVHLHNLALKSMSRTRAPKPASQEDIDKLSSLIVESGLIDIELPDRRGQMHKLSDLNGKVVLLDFTAYKTNYSANYNLALRKLYDKYADQGFEIFQVSFDSDESFWMNSSADIPWVAVYDDQSLDSRILRLYNVSQLPSVFLIDSDGNIVDRPDTTDSLDGKISALLNK